MKVTALYRHPIKSHGRESLDRITLHEGQCMPFDRHWAVAHEEAKVEDAEWATCFNFSRGSKAPKLMAINAELDENAGTVTLTHPERPDLIFDPDKDADTFLKWVMPLVPKNRALPARILRLAKRGFTDTEFPSVSLCNSASHTAVEALAGTPMSHLRWRANIWFEGETPWEEFDWIRRDVRIGHAILHVEEPIVRCLATSANPETGERDFDTLRTLNTLGHQNFGIYTRVIKTGEIAVGDTLELI